MAWFNEAWGWGGWFLVALLPLSFWAFIVVILVLVFRGPAPAPRPARATARERADEPSTARSETDTFGWRAPVPSHHRPVAHH